MSTYKDYAKHQFSLESDKFRIDSGGNLSFYDLKLMDLVKEYSTPFKLNYLPSISRKISSVRDLFSKAFQKYNYSGEYRYAYCTKSSHYKEIVSKALESQIDLEISHPTDFKLLDGLSGDLNNDTNIICNGYKSEKYLKAIKDFKDQDSLRIILDSEEELDAILESDLEGLNLGIRIATSESSSYPFKSSRLGIAPHNIKNVSRKIHESSHSHSLKMLHFFLPEGFCNYSRFHHELQKALKLYIDLGKEFPELSSINLGGGMPIRYEAGPDYDYSKFINEIVKSISVRCDEAERKHPNIYTEFGSFTVAESGIQIYKIIQQKNQGKDQIWNFINGSFITSLPDNWALNKQFLLLPLNRWNEEYEEVFLGGLSCDSDDYFHMRSNSGRVNLPKYKSTEPLYIGIFNVGAYQDGLSGHGGYHHCLMDDLKHLYYNPSNGKSRFRLENKKYDKAQEILGYTGNQ